MHYKKGIIIMYNRLMSKDMKKTKNGKSRKHNKLSKKSSKKYTRRQHGAGLGSDLRQKLVTLCRQGKWDEYDAVTQQIISDYRVKDRKDFFIHLDNQISTFKPETVLCLERTLTQLQEDGIPESMVHLLTVEKIRNSLNK